MIEKWNDPTMSEDEASKANGEADKVAALAKECGWDFYCVMGLTKNEDGTYASSTHAFATTPQVRMMVASLADKMVQAEAMAGSAPEHIV